MNINWFTNFPADYRLQIWNSLSERNSLKVFLTAPLNQAPHTWNILKLDRYTMTSIGGKNIKIDELLFGYRIKNIKEIKLNNTVNIVAGYESITYLYTIWRIWKSEAVLIQFYESTKKSHRFNNSVVRFIRGRIFSLADCIVTVGPDSTEAVLETGVDPLKILELFNPVDVKFFSEASQLRFEAHGLGHRFLFVGRLVELKNISNLIKAFHSIRNEFDTLTIVGTGNLLSKLQSLVESINLTPWVQFLGHQTQEELKVTLSKSDTLILPSEKEVWGLVVNEALAAGLHVVVSRNCGVSNFVEQMKGVYISDTSSESIALEMEKSRKSWRGAVANPEILKYTPERFSEILIARIQDIHRTRILWLTNIPAPYRLPVWSELSKRASFMVVTLNDRERNRSWEVDLSSLEHVSLGLQGIKFFEDTQIYFGWRKLRKVLLREKPNVLFIDGIFHISTIALLLIVRRNFRVFVGERATKKSHRFNNSVVRFIRGRIFSLADCIVTVGPDSTEAVLETGVDPLKILELFNPVDVKFFSEASQLRFEAHGLGHRFLFVGRLVELKNISNLIKAFHSIRNEFDTLTIVGTGNLLSKLQSLVESINLTPWVQFLGHQTQEELKVTLSKSDTLILPSEKEVWGLVVNEALAAGLHVVVSRNCGVSNFVEQMKGVYISDTSSESIALEMEKSRKSWRGAVANPEILKYTPERFSEILIARIQDD